MALNAGAKLGPYEITGQLGQGGMGTVYKARDPKLQRTVAIKVLASQDETASARLLEEARAASALSHPNVATVHEVDEHDGQPYIVMELVEGKPLSEIIPSDGLPPESVIRYGLQIADALAHAHEKGIIHRDLKSQNVVITPEGRAKVLDFGLAMRLEKQDAEAVTVSLDTQAAPATIAGTLAYIAPEVLRGEEATPRSDIWALGVLLYEMAAGVLPFGGTTRTDLVSAIMKETPASLPAKISPGLRNIIQHCLTKEPERRYRHASAIQSALEAIQSDSATTHAATAAPSPTRSWPLVAAMVLLVVLVSGLTYWLRPGGEGTATSASLPRLTNPRQLTRAVGVEDFPVISPDGTMLAYHSAGYGSLMAHPKDIWVTRLGEGEPINRTEDHSGEDGTPSWSPDGEQIAFVSDRNGDRHVFVMPVLAGSARQVSPLIANQSTRPAWSPDGTELAFTTVNDDGTPRISITSMETGEAEHIRLEVTKGTGGGGFSYLSWSPDGRLFAYNEGWEGNQVRALWVVRRADGVAFRVTPGQEDDAGPSWSPDSRTVYFVSNRGGSRDLWQQRLTGEGEPVGSPQPVTAGIGMANAAIAPDGRMLTYSRGGRVSHVWRIPILGDRMATWLDAEQITFDEAFIEMFDVSPNGERLALSSDRAGNPDVWVLPASGGEMQQITTDIAPDWSPRWSPNGQELGFYSLRSGNRDIWTVSVSGGPARQLTTEEWANSFPVWSPDGQEIAYNSPAGLWATPASGGEARLISVPGSGNPTDWSADGAWLLTSRGRVHVPSGDFEPLSDYASPRYSRDGSQAYFRRGMNLWVLSLEDRTERQLTDLTDVGRGGGLGGYVDVTDTHLYFTWAEHIADIWVMDVVQDEQ